MTVQSGFYKHVRHPQYLFLATAGLGLLIVWPRFILLIAYINMLWLYYLLAHDEERRMLALYGELYVERRRRTSMFLPGEPGGRLVRLLLGWIGNRRVRLLAVYALSLFVTIGAAFLLRSLTLELTTHFSRSDRKIAAISFGAVDKHELHRLLESAANAPEVQTRIKGVDDWILVQAMEGSSSVVHSMIDAGMTRSSAKQLPLHREGLKLVFSRRKPGPGGGDPFGISVRWQPVFVAENYEWHMPYAIDLDPHLFLGNPVEC